MREKGEENIFNIGLGLEARACRAVFDINDGWISTKDEPPKHVSTMDDWTEADG
jgi:hypothetical protein